MSIDEVRNKVSAGIWRSFAQSDFDFAQLPKDVQDELVQTITENMLITFDSIIADEFDDKKDIIIETDNEEEIIWKGRPFLSLIESYVITSERVKFITGFLSRHVENYELIRIQDLDFKQNISERILGIGDVTIRGQDPSDPILVLRNIPKPEAVYETLRKAWLAARKKYGLQFREFM